MYYSYVEIEYVATSFPPARTDLALKLLTKPGCVDIHGVIIWYTTTEVSLNCTWNHTYVNHMISRVSQPQLRIHKQAAYWNMYIKS